MFFGQDLCCGITWNAMEGNMNDGDCVPNFQLRMWGFLWKINCFLLDKNLNSKRHALCEVRQNNNHLSPEKSLGW